MKNELIADMLVLRPAAILTVGLTVAAYLVLLVLLPKINLRGDKHGLLLGFVGLSGRSLIHLSAAWVRFALYVSVLLLSGDIGRLQFIALALLTLPVLLLNTGLSAMLTELAGSAVLGAGLFVLSYLTEYLRLVRSGADTRAAYWLLAAFLILCAAIMLVREYILISGERNYFDETGECE